MNKKIKVLEKNILTEWKQLAQKNNDAENFSEDGLLFRGEIYYENGCWHRKEGDEEQRWAEADRRLLILTKDLNDSEAWDIKQETGRRNTAAPSYDMAIAFYKNLRMWSYGLLNTTAEHNTPFDTAKNMDISGPFYEQAPIARVNCKKQCGSSSIKDATFSHYLETYAMPLKRQIAIYDADIIICCGCSSGHNRILDFIKAQYLTDLTMVPDCDNWIYYSPSTGKIAINSYHPSARIGYENAYCGMIDNYHKALKYIKKHYNNK